MAKEYVRGDRVYVLSKKRSGTVTHVYNQNVICVNHPEHIGSFSAEQLEDLGEKDEEYLVSSRQFPFQRSKPRTQDPIVHKMLSVEVARGRVYHALLQTHGQVEANRLIDALVDAVKDCKP